MKKIASQTAKTDMSNFAQSYKNLNPAQKEAVDTIDGPVMVIAGPGTGKTTILTLRIANILLRTDTPAHGILAITYTDAGVKAMRAKLQAVIGTRAHDVAIHTFHSFAAAMIAEYPDHFLHLDGMKQMTDVDRELLVRKILMGPGFTDLRPLARPDTYIPAILRAISEAKRDALTPDKVRVYARAEIKRLENDPESLSTRGASKGKIKAEVQEIIEKCRRTLIFADIYEKYDAEKATDLQMDFDDLITNFLVAMEKDQLFLRLIQERYLYILVDEHQDTNDAQNFIISFIAQFFEIPNIFIVGDEKQAVYRFQGASVENFLLLQKRWPSMKVIHLENNYRSHQSILDAAFSMIEKNYEGREHSDLRVRLLAHKSRTAQPIDIVSGENTAAIENYLVSQLKKLVIKNNGVQPTVAIITRRNRDLDRVIRLLEANHIPVSSERSVDIFKHPVGVIYFELIQYLADQSRLDCLAKTIMAGLWDVSAEKIPEMIKKLNSGQTAFVETGLPALKIIWHKLLDDSPISFLVETAEKSGFTRLVNHDPAYIHVWRGIVSLAESLVREGEITSPAELLQKMLAYRQSAESKTVKIAIGAPDVPIEAMTAHGSKGLEFDYVFIPYATDEAWIGRTHGSSFILPQKNVVGHDIRDTRRLFYVAITRARQHVVILSAAEESDGRALTPLRFVSELDESHIKKIDLPRADLVSVQNVAVTDMASSKMTKSESTIVDLAKRTLLEKGLSVTALNHYMTCPNEFLYQSILKIPQAPSVPAERGNAMHSALAQVWLSDKSDLEGTLKKAITKHLDDSMLSVVEKTNLKKALLEDASAVAKALEVHFAAKGKVSTESWVQANFETATKIAGENSHIQIPIHGKLDVIDDDGQTVNVFDYKTKQAMSPASIKGETKNSDGNYFRQLIFYVLLMSSDQRWKMKKIVPSLVFVSPDDKGRCPTVTLPISSTDIERVKKEIDSLIESVWSGAIIKAGCNDQDCEWCALRGLLGLGR